MRHLTAADVDAQVTLAREAAQKEVHATPCPEGGSETSPWKVEALRARLAEQETAHGMELEKSDGEALKWEEEARRLTAQVRGLLPLTRSSPVPSSLAGASR